jgi:hypothetical protein
MPHQVSTTTECSPETDSAAQRYRFQRLSLMTILSDMRFERSAPKPGDLVPTFDLPTLTGSRIRSRDLTEIGPILLVFGSLTCPMTDSSMPGLLVLHARFAERVRFVLVSVREAHPGATVPQPQTTGEKVAHATALRDFHDVPFDVAIDDIDGTLHRSLSPKPNSAYLISRDCRITFRSHWANDTPALAEALQDVASGQAVRRGYSAGVMKAMLRMLRDLAPVLDRAGLGAWSDMWRIMPPLAAVALMMRFFRLSRQPTALPAAAGPSGPSRLS